MTHPFGKLSSRKKKRKPPAKAQGSSASEKQVSFAPAVSHIPVRRVAVVEPPAASAASSLGRVGKVVMRPDGPLRSPASSASPSSVPKTVKGPGKPLPPPPPVPGSLRRVPKVVKGADDIPPPPPPERLDGVSDDIPPPPPPLERVPKVVKDADEIPPPPPPERLDDIPPPPPSDDEIPPPPPPPEPGLQGVPKTVKLPAAPVGVRPVRGDLLNKTRRKSVELSGFPVGDERSQRNADANNAAMERLYTQYYGLGGRKVPGADLGAIYGLMGKGKTKYGEVPVSDADFQRFLQTPNTKINGQKVSAYRKALKEYQEGASATEPTGPKTEAESVEDGDYFHVHNRKYQSPDKTGRARRIIVNVNTQKAGLKVAAGLNDLIAKDPKVAGNLSEYKIYLSKTATSKQMKHDKLVIYYAVDPADPDGSDTIGNKIAAKINGSIKPEDIDEGFAPFYSNIAPGLAWAEEPKQYVGSMSGSFTRTRSDVIKQVIKSNPVIRSKEEFIAKVNAALDAAGVEADSPHRHQLAQ